MFGISPIGWVHTLGSLPAIPLAAYMFIRYGRIIPRSAAGLAYLFFMLIGAATVFFVAREPVSYVIGAATLILLVAGYGVDRLTFLGRAARYLETIFLSLTAFLLMIPTVTEILRRVPDGHPIVTELNDPRLLGAQGTIVVILVVGLSAQMLYLRRQGRLATAG